ncbi:MAG: hypothetical protein EA342_02730, partial [Leptolyngbya sp. LCM1.Bin17]
GSRGGVWERGVWERGVWERGVGWGWGGWRGGRGRPRGRRSRWVGCGRLADWGWSPYPCRWGDRRTLTGDCADG